MAQPSLVGQGAGRAWRQQTATFLSSWCLLGKSTRRMRIRPWFLSHSRGIRCGSNTNPLTLGCDDRGERERENNRWCSGLNTSFYSPCFYVTRTTLYSFLLSIWLCPSPCNLSAIAEYSASCWPTPRKKSSLGMSQAMATSWGDCDFYCWGLTATKVTVVLRPGCSAWIMGAL